ncbi:tyrosine-type recombinase/integrase [Thiolapillus sp.]
MQEVEAVKSKEQIEAVSALLANHDPLYADIWKFGLNTALRIQDLLSIRFSDIDLQRHTITLTEQKTGKARTITLNNPALEIVQRRREQWPDDTYLFQSHSPRLRRGVIQPVSRVSVSRAFKRAGDTLNLKINTHSMRKTRGYMMHRAGEPIERICKMLNHSHPAVTMRYIGLESEDIANSYRELEL